MLYLEKITALNPQDAKKNGIGFIPAERKTEGILSELTLRSNMTMPFLDNFISNKFINSQKKKKTLLTNG